MSSSVKWPAPVAWKRFPWVDAFWIFSILSIECCTITDFLLIFLMVFLKTSPLYAIHNKNECRHCLIIGYEAWMCLLHCRHRPSLSWLAIFLLACSSQWSGATLFPHCTILFFGEAHVEGTAWNSNTSDRISPSKHNKSNYPWQQTSRIVSY